MTAGRRSHGPAIAFLALVLAFAGAACRLPGADPVHTGDPANGITIDNATDVKVHILYESPDGGSEPLTDLGPDQQIVIDQIFAGRDGLCRTGRLVAHDQGDAEIDELYLVCRGGTWTIEVS
jgi:hypothetical protein